MPDTQGLVLFFQLCTCVRSLHYRLFRVAGELTTRDKYYFAARCVSFSSVEADLKLFFVLYRRAAGILFFTILFLPRLPLPREASVGVERERERLVLTMQCRHIGCTVQNCHRCGGFETRID